PRHERIPVGKPIAYRHRDVVARLDASLLRAEEALEEVSHGKRFPIATCAVLGRWRAPGRHALEGRWIAESAASVGRQKGSGSEGLYRMPTTYGRLLQAKRASASRPQPHRQAQVGPRVALGLLEALHMEDDGLSHVPGLGRRSRTGGRGLGRLDRLACGR